MDEFSKVGFTVKESQRQDTCADHGEFTSRGFSFGRNVRWMGCPECAAIKKSADDLAAAVKEAEDAQRRLESRMNQSGIPLRYRTKDFASYVADTDGKEKARAVAMEFASNIKSHSEKGTVMVFSGQPGTGKSHLAIAIAQSVMHQRTVLYISAIDAVRMIRNTWRRDSEQTETQVLDMLTGIGLLVLDEVGVQYGTEAEQVTLFDIIDKRYRDLMPMILLTNQNKGGMKTFLGDRSFDRLREGGIWVTFDWSSQRSGVSA